MWKSSEFNKLHYYVNDALLHLIYHTHATTVLRMRISLIRFKIFSVALLTNIVTEAALQEYGCRSLMNKLWEIVVRNNSIQR